MSVADPGKSMAALIERLRHPHVEDGERRDGRRQTCRLPARIHADARVFDAVVEDLGITGCRIRLEHVRFAIGTRVFVDLPGQGICRDGRVAWQRGTEAGVRFVARRAPETQPSPD